VMVDSTLVSDTIAYHHWNGRWTASGSARRSITFSRCSWRTRLEYLLRRAFGSKRHDQSLSRAQACRTAVNASPMLRAREVALNLGGVPRMNTFSKLYLALLACSVGIRADDSV